TVDGCVRGDVKGRIDRDGLLREGPRGAWGSNRLRSDVDGYGDIFAEVRVVGCAHIVCERACGRFGGRREDDVTTGDSNRSTGGGSCVEREGARVGIDVVTQQRAGRY